MCCILIMRDPTVGMPLATWNFLISPNCYSTGGVSVENTPELLIIQAAKGLHNLFVLQ